VVALLPLDPRLVEPALERRLLLCGHAHGGVIARPAPLVEREARAPDVRHDGMALALDDACAEDPLVELGQRLGVAGLDGDMVYAWHRAVTMPRTLLIVNPQASAVTPESIARVTAELREVRTVLSEHPGHATELAADADADAIVVFAGDGGFNEVLNGVGPLTPVGFVPGGGSSVLPRALGIPREPGTAARQLAAALRAGRTRRISVGRANGRRFGFAAAIGFPAEIVRRVDALGRANGRRPPDRAFALTVIRALAERRGRLEPELAVDGEDVAFALVANCDPYTYLARLPVRAAPKARFEGGLELVAPRRVRPLRIPQLTAAALLGRYAPDTVYRHDLDRVEIQSREPRPLQVDGEDLGDVTSAVFECERGALTVLV
jgi:diacylglycerol kinase family enzyme